MVSGFCCLFEKNFMTLLHGSVQLKNKEYNHIFVDSLISEDGASTSRYPPQVTQEPFPQNVR